LPTRVARRFSGVVVHAALDRRLSWRWGRDHDADFFKTPAGE
jgi:hypothetical protein